MRKSGSFWLYYVATSLSDGVAIVVFMKEKSRAMHVATTRRRHGDKVYEYHLVRRTFREGDKVRHETLANISKLPLEAIEGLRRLLSGEVVLGEEKFRIENPLPHGHVEAVLSIAHKLSMQRLLDRSPSKERDLVMAMIVQQIIAPGSKLAMSRFLAQSTLASELDVQGADQDDLYRAMDWLGERQTKIENRLARRHLRDGELVLYDVTSSYFEGHSCPLAEFGYSRDKRHGATQIIYGLLTDKLGCPISVEVFEGSLNDSKTVQTQIEKLKKRFKLKRVVFVSDRGMVTKTNIDLIKDEEDLGFISALKASQVKKLVKDGHLQLTLFDDHNIAEITDEERYPGERLIVCRNPNVASERARKREELLGATEQLLNKIKERVESRTLAGKTQIALTVGAELNRYKMKKHFQLEITDTSFSFARKVEQIKTEAALDGIYVLRTNATAKQIQTTEVVRSYKQLKEVERAFGTIKGLLEVRPIHHHLEERVRTHIFLRMLSYYLEWHLRTTWAELLFKDECPPIQVDPVAKATCSQAAQRKASTKRTAKDEPCHSFKTLIAELGRRTRNTIRLPGTKASFTQLSEPNLIQSQALQLIKELPKTT